MDTAFLVLEYLGIFVFALSGSYAASRKNLDLYGSMTLAIITALGGGLIRDVILGTRPPMMFQNVVSVGIALAAALYAYWFHQIHDRLKHPLRVLDAIGLAVFTILGSRLAQNAGYPPHATVFMGVISGTGGGMLRDVLTGDIPLVLQREVYAVASIAGALLYAYVKPLVIGTVAGEFVLALIAMAMIICIRLVAISRNWHLPSSNRKPGAPS